MSLQFGDKNETVRQWRVVMARRFAGYAKLRGELPTNTDVFGARAQLWQREYESRTGQPIDGIVSDADLRALGIEPNVKPLVLTCMGHLGIIDGGPEYLAARPLEVAGKVQIQMVGGFNNDAIPFQIKPQQAEMNRLLHLPELDFANRTWASSTHSRGALVFGKLYQERDVNDPIWRNYRGGLSFGDPKRPKDVVAPWVADKPSPGTRGLDPWCHPSEIPGVAEVSQHGDLYAETKDGTKDTELKTAIIKLVAYGQLFGQDSITEELLDLALKFGPNVWPLFQAITAGVKFGVNMAPHTVFDLGPATAHLAAVLGV